MLPKDISTTVIEPPEKLAKIVPAEEIVLSLEDVESILEKSGEDLTQDVIENQICPAILEHKNGKFDKIFTTYSFHFGRNVF